MPKRPPRRKPKRDHDPQRDAQPPLDTEALRMRFAELDAPRRAREALLLAAIRAQLPALEKLLAEIDEHWASEDLVYRFYHQSFKVYAIQARTMEIVDALRALLPEAKTNEWFAAIVAEGTGKRFELAHNERWLETTRPMLEAFFHARYFLTMVCRYGRELDEPQNTLPSGWAAVLYLYGLR